MLWKNIAPLCSCVLAIEPREIQVASILIILEFRVTHANCLFLTAKFIPFKPKISKQSSTIMALNTWHILQSPIPIPLTAHNTPPAPPSQKMWSLISLRTHSRCKECSMWRDLFSKLLILVTQYQWPVQLSLCDNHLNNITFCWAG